jgi:excisionase family DNA binding protein
MIDELKDDVAKKSWFCTVKVAAQKLNLPTSTVYRLCKDGELGHTVLAQQIIRISDADLSEYVQARKVSPSKPRTIKTEL